MKNVFGAYPLNDSLGVLWCTNNFNAHNESCGTISVQCLLVFDCQKKII